jgi:NAD(P)H-hydrate epimerase
MPQALLTVAEMYRADAAAIARGISGEALMARAGEAVADAVVRRWSPRPTLALCGPGNNGGDGFVAANLLVERGWPVTLALLGARDALKGGAALHAARWTGPVLAATPESLNGQALVVDALFGAGLARPLDGLARRLVDAIAASRLPVVAVDVPSGVHGDTGAVMGAAARADLTVTFFRAKPGHYLLPGRQLRGELIVADIGIPPDVLAVIEPRQMLNDPIGGPAGWRERLPRPGLDSHKYSRGHVLIVGGPRLTGAARLAAAAARRSGAGLVTIAAPERALPTIVADAPGLMVVPVETAGELESELADPRCNALLVGPGTGAGAERASLTRSYVRACLATGRPCVLDADALTVHAERPEDLFAAIRGPVVMTPHEGEFARLFAAEGDKLARTRAAARRSGAVVLLKGADTVIADPDGFAAINANAPPELATAGSGDVLAGIIVGLLAQGMTAFDAACAAAWLHGAAGNSIGVGLIAEDLPRALPGVIRRLRLENSYGQEERGV